VRFRSVAIYFPLLMASSQGFIPKLWDDWVYSENASAIPQTRQFLQSLHQKGYKLIYITGRQDYLRNATVGNLEKQGLAFFEQLVLRNSSEYKLTAYDYKSARRAQLAAQGWNIVGSIGDQLSDVDGDFAGLRMKVPNYMYFLP
jgi:predicted secreted acid phosphatase